MKVTSFVYNLNSPDPQRLARFYREVVGLQPNPNIGESAFQAGEGASFIIDGHSQVKGPKQEPARNLPNFFVDDIEAETKRLEGAGVKIVRRAGKEPWGGIITTFEDPDGNYAQLIEFKPG